MLKKYKLKELGNEVEIIAIDDVSKLVKDGFLIVQLKTLNPDAVNDMVEAIGLTNLPFPAVVTDASVTVWEVLEEKEKASKEENG